MPRKKIILNNHIPYHLTGRTVNREKFHLEIGMVWEIMLDQLKFSQYCYGVDVLAFVLMPNHFHLICKFPHGDMDKFMRHFMRSTSLHINEISGRINQVWGQRYYPSAITSENYFYNAYKYVYRNPVQAKICERAEDYEFSTLPSVCGLAPFQVPIHDELMLQADSIDSILNWVNTDYDEDTYKKIKKGIHRSEFVIAKDTNGKPHPIVENPFMDCGRPKHRTIQYEKILNERV